MRIVTAFNKQFQRLGDNCCESLRRHCERNPEDTWQHYHIPAEFPYPPSFYKLNVILDSLSESQQVLWMDADSMVVGKRPMSEIVANTTLNISKDENGPNCGVMAWSQCAESFQALDRLLGLREQFKDHDWWEQGALNTFIDELAVNYVEKRIFNAYQEDQCGETQILHIPGIHIHERTIILEAALANT